jgi:hypothetical protein
MTAKEKGTKTHIGLFPVVYYNDDAFCLFHEITGVFVFVFVLTPSPHQLLCNRSSHNFGVTIGP